MWKLKIFFAFSCYFAAFGPTLNLSAQPTTAPASTVTSEVAKVVADEKTAPTQKAFTSPAFITDLGQGNNARLVEVMLKRDGSIEFKADAQARADALDGYETLIIGVGASTKGLGAAGLDAESELERGKALIAAAKEAQIDIIGVHIGGSARRGELSDQFVEAVFRASSTFVAWEGGNKDGFLTKLAEETKIPYIEVEGKKEVGEKLISLFSTAEAGQDSP